MYYVLQLYMLPPKCNPPLMISEAPNYAYM